MIDRLQVYLASSLSNAPLNSEIAHALRAANVEVVLPQEFCPSDLPHERYGAEVYHWCLEHMKKSHAAILNLDSCGKDSGWEAGWFVGAKKPVIGIARATTIFLQDFMVKGGMDGIATMSDSIHKSLLSNVSLVGVEICRLESLSKFADFIGKVVLKKLKSIT